MRKPISIIKNKNVRDNVTNITIIENIVLPDSNKVETK